MSAPRPTGAGRDRGGSGEPVLSFAAPASQAWGERFREAFDTVRRRRHLEALDRSPVLEPLAASLDPAWVAVHRGEGGGTERFYLNEAARAVCRFAGVELPPMERVTGALPRPLELVSAGDLAHRP